MAKIDEIDRSIIAHLQKDGRISYTVLAKMLGISISSVSRRIERLVETGAIKITVTTNNQKLGYTSLAVIALNTDMNKIDAVCEHLKQYPNIGLIALSFGRFDILISVRFLKSDDMVHFIKNILSKIDGVEQVETFYIGELKQQGFESL